MCLNLNIDIVAYDSTSGGLGEMSSRDNVLF